MDERKIKYVDIEELVIDPCNVRGGSWDYDEELVQSVKQHGIHLPLIVRPLNVGGKQKYGIVCGGRRYHAALEAGLKKVPCIIQPMDDVEAMGASLEENVMRKNVPLWQIIEWVGKMYEKLRWDEKRRFKGTESKYKEISRITSLKVQKVRDYVRIALYLPEEVRALLRPREDRTPYQEERLQKILYLTRSPPKTLNITKALLILNELSDLPVEKQVEVAAYIINKTNEVAEKVVKLVKEYPNASIDEIDRMIKGKAPVVYKRTVEIDAETMRALENACLDLQKKLPDLIIEIVKEWLKKNFYL